MNKWVSKTAALLLAVLAAACGEKSPVTPTPPAPLPATLAMTCPAAISAASVDGAAVAVTFAAPSVTGGTAPVTTACSPASGTSFAVGTTVSTCTAHDAASTPQTATCSVSITVTRVPKLSVSSIDAFGDSITEGATSACSSTLLPGSFSRTAWETLRFHETVNLAGSYPTRLRDLLTARYTAQSVQVVNDGKGGERTDEGLLRIRTPLAARPQVLLLQEGANDINQGVARSDIVVNLRDMVRRGREAGAQVFLGTLLPQRPGACKAGGPDRIASTNDSIRSMAAAEGATVVDLGVIFSAAPDTLLGVDGLHPSAAGYEKIAATFFDVLKQRFEN